MYYKLNGKEIVEISHQEWVKIHPESDYHIRKDIVNGYRISTVFLSVPEYLTEDMMTNNPLFFETAVFDDKKWQNGYYVDIEKHHYATQDEAEKCHQAMLQKYR